MSILQALFGPPNIEKLEAKQDIKGLTKALGYDKDYKIQDRAVEALGRIGAPAIEPLVMSLRNLADIVDQTMASLLTPKDEVHIGKELVPLSIYKVQKEISKIITALGKVGTPAIESLIVALNDNNVSMRCYAVKALGEIGNARAMEALVVASEDTTKFITFKNQGIAGKTDRVFRRSVCEVAIETMEKFGPSAVEPLITALRNGNHLVRGCAAKVLGNTGNVRAVEALAGALSDADSSVRREVVDALYDIQAVEPLITALKDEDSYVRQDAVDVLGKIGDIRAVEPLITVLKDEDMFVRLRAVEVLGKMGDIRAIDPLIQIKNDKEELVQKKTLEVLHRMNSTLPEKRILFPRYTEEGGQCNVCDKPLSSGEAYLVPKEVFYSSRKYKEFVPKTLAGAFTSMLGGDVDLYIASALKTEKRTEIGVCSSCIHLFE